MCLLCYSGQQRQGQGAAGLGPGLYLVEGYTLGQFSLLEVGWWGS